MKTVDGIRKRRLSYDTDDILGCVDGRWVVTTPIGLTIARHGCIPVVDKITFPPDGEVIDMTSQPVV